MQSKRCARCKQEKPLDDFGFDPRMASGHKSYCDPCNNAWARENYQRNTEALKAAEKRRRQRRKALGFPPSPSQRASRLRRYGITPEQWDELYAQQQGRCAICGTETPGGRGNRFHVDHDHTTGRVRSLLCHHCNVGIGMLGGTVERLQAVINYLESHRG